MTKFVSTISAVAISGLTALTSVAPAQAYDAPALTLNQRNQVIQTYCDRNPRDRDCRSFYRGGWNDRQYYNFYSSRRSSIDNIAAGIFGFTFGAALGSIIANSNNNRNDTLVYRGAPSQVNVAACQARYRSYDVQTNTFLGYDGIRHQCRL
ncbi:BA14K-like protein [Devosia crocina]|uniref:Lectin-like protein BA14k n=1 Tax=Devosia crocina TaxID=429728 RepID=A0A1I7NJV0_9HYPH|nr:BA14K family protein [Devosia crocina]SFV34927.1 BA14K-like protein [Devosia crocina]